MRKNRNVVGAMLFFCGCISLQTTLLIACNVPVFRYALQRWQPDDYEITVLHYEPLSAEHQEMMDKLQQAASDRDRAMCFDGRRLPPRVSRDGSGPMVRHLSGCAFRTRRYFLCCHI